MNLSTECYIPMTGDKGTKGQSDLATEGQSDRATKGHDDSGNWANKNGSSASKWGRENEKQQEEEMSLKINRFQELDVYKNARSAAMEIFNLSKSFPVEEKYSLTDQIRRSSRSVCANLAEAWRKRQYKAAFIAKIVDCESEAAETLTWLEFASDCNYLDPRKVYKLKDAYDRISGQLIRIKTNSDKWILTFLTTP